MAHSYFDRYPVAPAARTHAQIQERQIPVSKPGFGLFGGFRLASRVFSHLETRRDATPPRVVPPKAILRDSALHRSNDFRLCRSKSHEERGASPVLTTNRGKQATRKRAKKKKGENSGAEAKGTDRREQYEKCEERVSVSFLFFISLARASGTPACFARSRRAGRQACSQPVASSVPSRARCLCLRDA